MSKSKTISYDRIGLWMILAVVVLSLAVFLWTREHYKQTSTSIDTHVDKHGHLHVLGITLEETRLREAENILQSKSDVALYIYPKGHAKAGRKLEAFFPSIADHTKVILLLKADTQTLDQIEERATIPHLYPNQVARMNLAVKDKDKAQQAVVTELTLIPNLTISAATLQARFGKPDKITVKEGYDEYIYQSLGLQVMLYKDEPPTLHFFNPNP